jgi:hypothetical protein
MVAISLDEIMLLNNTSKLATTFGYKQSAETK